jgi:hypothetical protein
MSSNTILIVLVYYIVQIALVRVQTNTSSVETVSKNKLFMYVNRDRKSITLNNYLAYPYDIERQLS